MINYKLIQCEPPPSVKLLLVTIKVPKLSRFHLLFLQEIRASNFRESAGFPVIYLTKIVLGRLRNDETWLRTLYRVAFTFVAPGFTSHFPCEYERKLRKQLESTQE